MKPLHQWNAENNRKPGLVWSSQLDDRYILEVQRTGSHTGNLFIFDHNNDDKILHQEVVPLYYGAIYGADVSDVAAWQEIGIKIVDG